MAEKQKHSLTQPAYLLLPEHVVEQFDTDVDCGLSQHEARQRNEIEGDNTLQESAGVSIWSIFIRQVANALTLVHGFFTSPNLRYWLWLWHCPTERRTSSKVQLLQ